MEKTELVKSELGKEITELFDGILDVCNGKSFPSVKAALLLTRDHIVSLEATMPKTEEEIKKEE